MKFPIFKVNADHFRAVNSGAFDTTGRTDVRINIYEDDKIIHVTGQASNQTSDWKDNLDMRRRPKEQWFKGIWVHAGFFRQYQAVRNTLLDVCYRHPDYAIRVDGFSLGASWTQLFIQDCLHRWPNRDIKAILYAPGNPWRKLPRKYRRKLRQCITFVYCFWDVVTWMRLLGFKRYGRNVRIGRIWRIWPKQHHPDQIIRALNEMEGV